MPLPKPFARSLRSLAALCSVLLATCEPLTKPSDTGGGSGAGSNVQVRVDLSGLGLTRVSIGTGPRDTVVLAPVGYQLPTLPIQATVSSVPIQNPTYVLLSRDPSSVSTSGTSLRVLRRTPASGVWVLAVLQAGVNTGGAAPTDSIRVRGITDSVVTTRPTAVLSAVADTTQLTAIALGTRAFGTPDTIGTPGFTWSSTNPSVATVDVNGRLASITNGTATVFAKSDFDSVAITVTVKQQIASWRLSRATLQLNALGKIDSLTAAPFDVRGRPVDTLVTNGSPTFDIDSLAGLTVNGKKVVMTGQPSAVARTLFLRARATSNDTAVVRSRGGSAGSTVNIGDSSAVTIRQLGSLFGIGRGSPTRTIFAPLLRDTIQVTATDSLSAAINTPNVQWTSSAPSVVRVAATNLGEATLEGLAVGTATITARLDGATQTFAYTVVNPPATVAVSPRAVGLVSLKDTLRLSATVNNRANNVIASSVTWSVQAAGVVSVDPTGLLTALGPGSTKVFASAGPGVLDSIIVRVDNDPNRVVINRLNGTPVGTAGVTLASVKDSLNLAALVTNTRLDTIVGNVVTWAVRGTNPPIAVTPQGVVIALAQGTATLVASATTAGRGSNNVTFADSIPVTVTNAPARVILSTRGTITYTSLPQSLVVRAGTENARGDTIAQSIGGTWTLSNATVGTIASNPDVATLQNTDSGSVLLTKTVPSGSGTVTDTLRIIASNQVSAITVNNNAAITFPSVGRGQSVTASAANPAGGVIPNVTFAWSSTDPTVASVNQSGQITALKQGAVKIQAGFASKIGEIDVTVLNAPDTVRFTSADTVLTSIGDSYQPGVVLKDAAGNTLSRATVSWTSSSPSKVSVADAQAPQPGLVTATDTTSGVLITAASGAATSLLDAQRVQSRRVVVRNDPALIALNFSDDTLTARKRTIQYTADVRNARNVRIANATVTWSSSAPAIVSVDGSGLATAIDTGNVIITASTSISGVVTTAKLRVTNNAASVSVTPGAFTIAGATRTQQLTARAVNLLGDSIPNPVITWTSLQPSVATVSGSGLVTAVTNGVATITATVNGAVGSAAVTVQAGAPSAATSTIATSASSVVADGVASALITVQLKDVSGNNITSGTQAVTISSTVGSVSTVSGGNGTYTATVTSTTLGTGTISATVASAALTTAQPTVTFVAGPASASRSTISASSANGVAGGGAITLTFQSRDAIGNLRAVAGDSVVVSTAGVGTVALPAGGRTNAAGVFTTTISSTTAGLATISATVNNSALTSGSPGITFAPGAAASLAFALTRSPSASGTAGVALAVQPVVQVRDANGNVLTGLNTGTITATIGSGATVAGATATITGGVATFTALTVSGTAAGYTLTFSDGTRTVTSGFTLNAGAVTTLAFAPGASPSASAGAGITLVTQPVVRALDANGNVVTTAAGTMTATVSSGATLTSSTATLVNGVATFAGLTASGTAGNYTLSFSDGTRNLTSALQLVAGTPVRLAVVAQPSGARSGVAFTAQPTVQLLDASGNRVLTSTDPVTVAIRNGGGSLGGTATVNAAAGLATFSGISVAGTIGARSLDFTTSLGGVAADTSATFTLTFGNAAKLVVATEPAGASSGLAFTTQPAVRVLDASDNLITTSSAPVTAAIASGGGTLSGTATVNAASGIASFSGLAITGAAGARTLTFTSAALTAATSSSFNLGIGTPAALTFQTTPSTTAASGIALTTQPVLLVVDGAGNRDTTFNGTLAVNAPGVTLTGNSVAVVKGLATLSSLTLTGSAGSYTLTFTDGTRSVQSSVALSAGAAASLAFGTAPSASAGSGAALSAQPVVRVLDGALNLVTTATGTVTASIGSGASLTSATATITGGIATFSGLTATGTAGSYTLSFTDGTRSITSPFTLGAGAGTALAMVTEPAGANSGAAFGTQPVVRVLDASGNVATSYSGTVTASIGSGGGTLSGTAGVTVVNGVATFTNLSILGTAGARTLSFASGALTAVTSASFSLGAGVATQLAIITAPPATTANDAVLSTVTVQLRDASGNAVSNSGVTVNASIGSGGGSLLGTLSATTDPTGLATFTDLRLRGTLGSRTLTFASNGLTFVTSSGVNINAAGALAQIVLSQAPTSGPAIGAAFVQQPAVQLADVSGNAVSSSGVQVVASLFSGAGTLTGTTSVTTSGSGVAAFGNLGITGLLGDRVITFTAGSLTINSPTLTPVAGLPTTAVIGTAPVSVAVAATMGVSPSVTITDAGTNPVSGVTVTLTASGGVSVTGGATAVTNASGVATFTGVTLVGTIGTPTITFTSATGSATATSGAITLSVGAPSTMTIGTAPVSVAVATNMSVSPTVTVRDAGNNVLNNISVTATASNGVTVSAGNSATTNPSGVATFTGVQLTGTIGSRTMTFTAGAATATSSAITLSVGPAFAVANTVATSTVAVGTSMSPAPSVTVTDAGGNVVPSQLVTVTASNSVTVTAGGSATTNGSGVATFTGLQLSGSTGSRTLTYTAGTATQTSAAFNLTAGLSNTATINQVPTNVAVAATMSPAPTITITDAGGNTLSGVTVNVTASGTATVLGGGSAVTNGSGVATFNALQLTGTPQSTQLTFTAATGTATATASAITLSVGAPASVQIGTAPTDVTVATTMSPSPTVTVRDQANNLLSGITVTATASGGRTVSAGNTASTNGSGVATFGALQLSGSAGSVTLTFTAGTASATSTAITLGAGAPATVTIGTAPTNVAVATTMTPSPTVTVRDAGSNTLSGVTVTATASGGRTVSAGSTATTNGSGVATFTGLQLSGMVGSITLTFTAGTATVDATPITLSFGTATKLVLTQQPTSGQVGTVFSTQPIIEVQDVSNNVVTNSTVSVVGAIASGGGTLKGTDTRNAVAGVVTHTNLYVQGNTTTKTLVFTSSGLTSATTGNITFTVGSPDTLRAVGATFTDVAGAAHPISATVLDVGGNPVPGVTVTFNAPSAGSRSPTSAVTNGSGVAATTWTLGTTAGTQTLTASISSGSVTTAQWTATATAGAATQIAANSSVSQSATVGTAVSAPPSVIVRDANNNPKSGVAVTFTVTSGGGSTSPVSGSTVTTDVNGVATLTSWTLGTTAGANQVEATVTGLTGSPVTFDATGTAGAATQIAANSSVTQSATAGTTVSAPPSVLVRDANNNPKSGVNVTFTVTSGGGSTSPVSGSTVTTDVNGVATLTSWTLGTTVGANQVQATVTGLTGSPVTFDATGTVGAPTQISINAGNGQSATVGTAVTTPPSALVQDANNNPVSGVSVTFAVSGGGGSVLGGSATTDASGIATVTSWTLGTTAGANSLSATSTGLTGSPLSFTATGTAGAPTQIAVSSGDGQSATVGTSVTPTVIVRDVHNNPVAGVSVTFANLTGGGSVSGGGAATTNAGGLASVTWTLGNTAGANSLEASSAGLTGSPVAFSATGTAGTATQLVMVVEPSTVANAVAMSTAPSVRLTDAFGNHVSQSGVSVAVSVTAAGGTVTAVGSVMTDVSGVATFTGLTMTGLVGSKTLDFASTGLTGVTSASFSLTVGAATQIAANSSLTQSAVVGNAVGTAPSVIVKDAGNNPVSNVSVTFAVTVGGGGVVGGSATTDAGGIAAVTSWTLGTVTGANAMTATSTGLTGSPVTFNATGTVDVPTQITIDQAPVADNTGAFTQQPVITVRDQYGNAVGAGVSVAATLDPSAQTGALTGTATLSTNSSGQITWSLGLATVVTGDSYTITFTTGAIQVQTGPIVIPP